MKYKVITDVPNLKGKKVLVRVGLNISVKDINHNHLRLRKALEMINYLRIHGAKVIAMSHIGREPNETLLPFVEYFEKHFPVTFIDDIYGPLLTDTVSGMKEGDVVLLENLRRYEGEKENSDEMARHLASFADIYVNDAFAVAHRAHTSVVGVPKYLPSYAGLQFDREIKNLSKVFNPEHPFVMAIGGIKFQTKMPLIKRFLDDADKILVIGGLANDIYKAQGFKMGGSFTSEEKELDFDILKEKDHVIVPPDVVTLNKDLTSIKPVSEVTDLDKVVDAGTETISMFQKIIDEAKLVVWNGPFGMYEQGFVKATNDFAKMLAKSKAHTIVGGGDTLSAIDALGIYDEFDFVSTGGGAMLEFLEKGTVVGLEALSSSK